MKRFSVILFCCCASLLFAGASGRTQDRSPAAKAPQSAKPPLVPLPLNHGGKIETQYDGFRYETVVELKKMGVTCGAKKGVQGSFKDTCVSLAASLHCPGKQLDFVRYARVRLIFEAKDWDSRHPAGSRDLVVVDDGESLKLGTMELVGNAVDSGLLDEKTKEVLEISVPYQTFQKIARAQYVEMSVGRTAFGLRDKNVAALRDLDNRVRVGKS